MDFDWTAEQRRLRDAAFAFAREHLDEAMPTADAGVDSFRKLWRACAEFGIQGLPIPKEYGGGGADPLTVALVLEALGHACSDSGLLFALGAHMWSCALPIALFGTEEQRRRYLPGLCDGSLIGVQAVTEPDSGSDAFSLTTRAEVNDDRCLVILHGRKRFITSAPAADVFVVFATSDPELGFAGISAYLVGRSTPGVLPGPLVPKLGLHSAPMGDLELASCTIPGSERLGPPGSGAAIFSRSMEWERSFILAGAVGTMQRQLEQCVRHAHDRRQFGRPIGDFQAVSHRIADMKVRLETARLLLYHRAWQLSRGTDDMSAAALTKLYLSECLVASSLDALQIHGAAGYLAGSDTERDIRDALGSRLYSGTSDIQRNLIAAGLGL